MTTLICILLPLLLIGALVATIIAVIAQQGRKMKELCEYGVETTATVESNELLRGYKIGGFFSVEPKSADRRREIVYGYADRMGTTHSGSYSAPAEEKEFAGLDFGHTFPVVYSSRNPSASAPKLVVDQFRRAFQGGRG
jgi:hypothetical protein